MNNSGKAVLKAMHRWRLRVSDIIVVVDDVNLDLGYLKIREKGSSGSHNGLKSIIDWLNSDCFTRFRIGIGPKPPDHDMIDFVCDASEAKQNKFLPGSHIKILNPSFLYKKKVDYVLILPWNIKEEILNNFSSLKDRGVIFFTAINGIEML